MAGGIPSDQELFPDLDENRISSKALKYREAVKENLTRLAAETNQRIRDLGCAGARASSQFKEWYPPERHESQALRQAEREFNSAILNGTIDGFPGIEDLWISNGDVLHTYFTGHEQYKAQIYYGNGHVGPEIYQYFEFGRPASEHGEYLTDYAQSFHTYLSGVTDSFHAFLRASAYLKAKKKKEELDSHPGCSPIVVVACVLLTALGVFLQNRGIGGALPSILMMVFGALSIGGIFMLVKSPKKGAASITLDNVEYHISAEEESKLKKAMDDEYLQSYRMYRYLYLWKKHLDACPEAYPKRLNCNGEDMIPLELRKLGNTIKSMESFLKMYRTFPSTEGVKNA